MKHKLMRLRTHRPPRGGDWVEGAGQGRVPGVPPLRVLAVGLVVVVVAVLGFVPDDVLDVVFEVDEALLVSGFVV